MKTLHIALAERADGGDRDYEAIKARCEDADCGPDDVHHESCMHLRPHVTFHSASPQRTTNNVMRHEYRQLTDVEKQQMQDIKDKGLDFLAYLHNMSGTLTAFNTGSDPKLASRALSVAATKIEEAVMWAVKHVTR